MKRLIQPETVSRTVAAEVTSRALWSKLRFPPPHVGSYKRGGIRKPLPALIALVLILSNPIRGQSGDAPKLTADLLRGLPLRNIGPALQPGRVADIAVDPRNRSVWYVATAS